MTLSITAAVDTLVPQPRIRLSVTGTSSTPNAVGTASTVVVYRTDPDGVRRKVIVNAGSALSGGAWVGFDYHMPFNQSVSYSAVVDGVTSPLASVVWSSVVSWLAHPNNPNRSVQVSAINEIGDRTMASTAQLSYAIGAKYPVAVSEGVRRSAAGQLVVRLGSRAEQDAVVQLLSDSGPVLLNLAAVELGAAWWDEQWAWVVPGDVTFSNPAGSIYYPFRHLAFPYTVVDTPVGSEVPIWTFGMVKAAYATFADVAAAFQTFADLATNTQSTAGFVAAAGGSSSSSEFDGGSF